MSEVHRALEALRSRIVMMNGRLRNRVLSEAPQGDWSSVLAVDESGPGAPPVPPSPLERTFGHDSVAVAVAENDLE